MLGIMLIQLNPSYKSVGHIHILEMKLNSVIAVLPVVLCHIIPFTNCILTPPPSLKCENDNEIRWLSNLRNNNRCLNIIVHNVFVPQCYYDQIFDSRFVIKTNDLNSIKFRNILSFQRTNCDDFMIFTNKMTEVFTLFQETNKTVKRFLPFSQFYLVPVYDSDIEFDQRSLSYIYKNGLFVYVVANTLTAMPSGMLTFSSLKNVLTLELLNLEKPLTNEIISYFGTYKNHPTLDTNYQKNIIRVSLFDCSPYVVYLPDGNFDGLEYRVLKEIVKNWIIVHNKCDTSETIHDPYGEARGQVQDHQSDLAMCSVWLNEKSNTYLDVTSYINYECATFLVPKPESLNPATYLYKSLNVVVGCSVVISLIVLSIILTIFGRMDRKIKKKSWNGLVYVAFSRSLFDTFGICTAQSLKFPKEYSIKYLLFGLIR